MPPPIRRTVVGSGTEGGGWPANDGKAPQRRTIPADTTTIAFFIYRTSLKMWSRARALLFFLRAQMTDEENGAKASAHQEDGGRLRNYGCPGKRGGGAAEKGDRCCQSIKSSVLQIGETPSDYWNTILALRRRNGL
jgi:hypothetical protein